MIERAEGFPMRSHRRGLPVESESLGRALRGKFAQTGFHGVSFVVLSAVVNLSGFSIGIVWNS